MNYVEYFNLTASSPQDLRHVAADYLLDLGLDLESLALRSGIFADLEMEYLERSINAEIYSYGEYWGCGDGDGTGYGFGNGESEGSILGDCDSRGTSGIVGQTNYQEVEGVVTCHGHGQGYGNGDGTGV